MHIICPHCTTSYAIDLATLGVAGRTVRCSRCREVWLARPEDAAVIKAPAMADAGLPAANADADAEWDDQRLGAVLASLARAPGQLLLTAKRREVVELLPVQPTVFQVKAGKVTGG